MTPAIGTPAIGTLLRAAADHAGGGADDLAQTPVGVRIHVEILPRACVDACAGGELPLTGGGGAELLLWIAAGLLLAGAALLAMRAVRRRA
ncbi:MAG: LPXTG cell wall anchor domain-containing protein [Actinobacteria bacterium]|nr:LPXTG cell wall anchor domain-containing protein [Actinomycetota bacterium]